MALRRSRCVGQFGGAETDGAVPLRRQQFIDGNDSAAACLRAKLLARNLRGSLLASRLRGNDVRGWERLCTELTTFPFGLLAVLSGQAAIPVLLRELEAILVQATAARLRPILVSGGGADGVAAIPLINRS